MLKVDVQVSGSGTEKAQPGAGLTSRAWSVANKASYRIVLRAQAASDGTADSSGAANGETDEAWEKKWEAKTAACNGDEQCELQVAMAQAQDPHAIQQMQQMSAQAAMAAISPPGAAMNGGIGDAAKVIKVLLDGEGSARL